MKRIGGAPTASAREMGARGAAFSRAQGARTARQPARRRRQRRPGAGPRRRPPGRRDRGNRTRLRLDSRTGRRHRDPLRRGAAGRPASPPPRSTFPGLGSARLNTDFAVQRVGLSKAALRARRRGPLPPLRRDRRRDGDAEHRDLPGLLPEAGRLRAPRSPPASCAGGSASTGSRSPTRSTSSPSPTSAARPRPARAAARAGTDILLFTDRRAGARAERALLRGLRSGALRRADFETSAGRVLRLRHRLGRARRGARRRARPPWPRTSRRRRRRGPCRSRPSVPSPNIAIPMLAVIWGTPSGWGTWSRIAAVIVSATARASVASHLGRTMANSSPPIRASTSVSRIRRPSTPAISPITRSPIGCPRVSLTGLKLSRSSSSRRPASSLPAAACQLGPQVFLEAPPVLEPGERVVARRGAAAPASARCGSRPGPGRRAARPARRRRRRSGPAGGCPAGWGRGRRAARCGRRS